MLRGVRVYKLILIQLRARLIAGYSPPSVINSTAAQKSMRLFRVRPFSNRAEVITDTGTPVFPVSILSRPSRWKLAQDVSPSRDLT